jgi:Holliday junction resolvase
MSDRNRETSLWGWLKDHLKELRPLRHHVIRIENAIAKGTPDVQGTIAGTSFWCELKVAYPMAGDKWRIKIEQSQVNFAVRQRRAGGRAWVLVRTCGKSWRDNRHYLIDGLDAHELQSPVTGTRLAELSASAPSCAAVELLRTMVDR